MSWVHEVERVNLFLKTIHVSQSTSVLLGGGGDSGGGAGVQL